MLFVMRTWALVRSLNRKLGGTTRQRFLTMGEHAATGGARRARQGPLRCGEGAHLTAARRADHLVEGATIGNYWLLLTQILKGALGCLRLLRPSRIAPPAGSSAARLASAASSVASSSAHRICVT